MAEKHRSPAEYLAGDRLVDESKRRRAVADYLIEIDPSENSKERPTIDPSDPKALRTVYVQQSMVYATEVLLRSVASAICTRRAYAQVRLDGSIKPNIKKLPLIQSNVQLPDYVKTCAMLEGISIAQTRIGSDLVEAFSGGGQTQQPLERWKRKFIENKLPRVAERCSRTFTVFAQETLLPGVVMELAYGRGMDLPRRYLTVYPLSEVLQ